MPLSFYFKDGKVKVELALARGRRKADKRNTMAERDAQRDIREQWAGRQRAEPRLSSAATSECSEGDDFERRCSVSGDHLWRHLFVAG